ncbi:hypothetical protein DSD19_12085 [Rhodovulum sp. BSW8]|nr:hypothetical protein DSD19_12085 [Rhodovulum sp. BSW8]
MKTHIHCGFHKTASTYLQRVLRDNAKRLSCYLTIINRIELGTYDLRMACLAYNSGRGKASAVRAELDRLAQRVAGSDRPVLITDEAFFGPHIGQDGETRLFPRAHEVSQMMVEAFAPHPVEILLYTRDESSWLKSVHNQSVKQDRYSGSFEEFLAEIGGGADLDAVTARIAATIGPERVQVFRLEDDRSHPFGSGGALLDHVGIPREVQQDLKRASGINQSLDARHLRIMRRLNGLALPDFLYGRMRRGVLRLQRRARARS